LAFKQLHDNERLAIVLINVMNCANVGMVQGGSRSGFPPELFNGM
jgi:hypothetical protein